MEPHPARPSLEQMLEDYWRLLPAYQHLDEERGVDQLRVERVMFGLFPSWKASPLQPGCARARARAAGHFGAHACERLSRGAGCCRFDRVLQIGDASGIQSPLSFGGFGALTRHLPRVSGAVVEALQVGALAREDLALINAYNPGLSASWYRRRARAPLHAPLGSEGATAWQAVPGGHVRARGHALRRELHQPPHGRHLPGHGGARAAHHDALPAGPHRRRRRRRQPSPSSWARLTLVRSLRMPCARPGRDAVPGAGGHAGRRHAAPAERHPGDPAQAGPRYAAPGRASACARGSRRARLCHRVAQGRCWSGCRTWRRWDCTRRRRARWRRARRRARWRSGRPRAPTCSAGAGAGASRPGATAPAWTTCSSGLTARAPSRRMQRRLPLPLLLLLHAIRAQHPAEAPRLAQLPLSPLPLSADASPLAAGRRGRRRVTSCSPGGPTAKHSPSEWKVHTRSRRPSCAHARTTTTASASARRPQRARCLSVVVVRGGGCCPCCSRCVRALVRVGRLAVGCRSITTLRRWGASTHQVDEAADEQVPGEDVRPLLRHEDAVLAHAHHVAQRAVRLREKVRELLQHLVLRQLRSRARAPPARSQRRGARRPGRLAQRGRRATLRCGRRT
eukprot:scaffold1277_cov329-Prasinococcus_capsulatus_cf.AAC.11